MKGALIIVLGQWGNWDSPKYTRIYSHFTDKGPQQAARQAEDLQSYLINHIK